MTVPDLRYEVITQANDLLALQSEWEALWLAANGRFTQRFAVCWASWKHISEPAGETLSCVIARHEGKLMAVWPLVRRRGRLFRTFQSLDSQTTEYAGILTDPSLPLSSILEALWQRSTVLLRSDVLFLPYVQSTSALYALLRNKRDVLETAELPSSAVLLSQIADWSAYCASLGTISGRKPGGHLKQLAKLGNLEIKVLGPNDRTQNARYLDWMLEQKRQWSMRTQKTGPWLSSNHYRDYLLCCLNSDTAPPTAHLIVVSLDDEPVAVNVIGRGVAMIDGLIAGFQSEKSKYSPGLVSLEHALKWAHTERLDIDFGVGAERFKAFWSRGGFIAARNLQIATSVRGRLYFLSRRIRDFVKRQLRQLRKPLPQLGDEGQARPS